MPRKAYRFLLLAVLGLLSGTTIKAQQYSFSIVDGAFTWHEAVKDAVFRGGHLATITSPEEFAVLESICPNRTKSYWLGATDEGTEGVWRWITGEAFAFSNWEPGEPNNVNGGQNYVQLYMHGKWDDIGPAQFTLGYILEFEPPRLAITSHPLSILACFGSIAKFTVEATNAIAFQWLKDGLEIKGATNSDLTITNVHPPSIGEYRAIARNASGSVTSGVASLTIEGFDPRLWRGLVAYYPFSSDAKDASGNGNDAALINNARIEADQIDQTKSLLLTGGYSDWVEVGNPSFGLKSTGSISVWFYNTNINNSDARFICGNQIGEQMEIHLGGNPKSLVSGIRFIPKPGVYVDTLAGTPFGQWVHLVCVAGAGSNGLKIYVNGEAVPVSISGGGDVDLPLNMAAGNYFLGRRGTDNGWAHFMGRVKEFRIYNRDLSEVEVKALYDHDSTPRRNDSFTNGLIAYYPFNGNANDESGGGRNATVSGPSLVRDRFGNEKSAYRFHGDGGSIYVNPAPNFWASGRFSFSCWFSVRSGGLYQPRLINNGTLDVGLTDTSGSPKTFFAGWGFDGVFPEKKMTPDAYYNLIGTFDGRTAVLYLNGVKLDSKVFDWALQITSLPLSFGRNPHTGTDWFCGT